MELNTNMSDNRNKGIPEEITSKITAGWIAALVSVGMTAGLMLVSINFGAFNLLFNKWLLLTSFLFVFLLMEFTKRAELLQLY